MPGTVRVRYFEFWLGLVLVLGLGVIVRVSGQSLELGSRFWPGLETPGVRNAWV